MRCTFILVIIVSVITTQYSWSLALTDISYQKLLEKPDSRKPEPDVLPFFVTICYHIEPNSMLFETVEPGYFDAVSSCLRQMSQDLAAVNVNATFCFAWLYNDIVCHRNHDPRTGEITNSPLDTGIETYQQIIADGHELAYHSHPPMAIVDGPTAYYTRPNSDCTGFDTENLHRWTGLGADQRMDFSPGVYEFDDPADPWYGQLIWERTSESLFRIADHLNVDIRHTNGGQKPLLDLTDKYGSGINHPHCLKQIRSLIQTGFDLIAPETMAFFSMEYNTEGDLWSDPSTGYVSYFGSNANVQIYHPDIDGGHIERKADVYQGLTFMPVQKQSQGAWMGIGERNSRYYDAEKLGGKGGGGVQWDDRTFYSQYFGKAGGPWADSEERGVFPSLADQFNSAMRRHIVETPGSVNSWGFIHHVVNVMWSDLSGLSDNWDRKILFIRDIADGVADETINEPRPDLVQFVTMQTLSQVYEDTSQAGEPQVLPGDVNDDGLINSADAILVLRIAAGLLEPTESQRLAADMDGNGEIRANDAIIMLRKVVGLAAPSRD